MPVKRSSALNFRKCSPGIKQTTISKSLVWANVCHKEWDTTERLNNNNNNNKDKKELISKAEGDSWIQKQIYGYQRGNRGGYIRRWGLTDTHYYI